MRLLFIYGPVASGKLTIARRVAERTGLPLFHNHLIVDAVAAVFPFGSQEFIRLRERFWIETISTAAEVGQSLIFTFAPEATVADDFPARVSRLVEAVGGEVIFVALDVEPNEQERRLVDPTRMAFGKLRSPEILRDLRNSMAACMQAMPQPAMRFDTGEITPEQAADAILQMTKRVKRSTAPGASAG
jgi:hypothetical protein